MPLGCIHFAGIRGLRVSERQLSVDPWMTDAAHRGPMPWPGPAPPEDDLTQAGLDAIGRMVRDHRLRRGWSQRDLEWMSGIDQTVISRIENGRQYGVRWSRFARLLGVLSSDRVPPGR
jgi:ribosome-binding protein aMBF1 (putative translation factor)